MGSKDSSKTSQQEDFQVPDFGPLDPTLLEADKTYHCRVYRMSEEVMKAVTEHTSFTARFDSPNMRTAIMDLWKSTGKVIIEIERNAKPKEISVRYPKDRWTVVEAQTVGAEGLKPSIKTEYGSLVLGPKAFAGIAETLKLPPELMQQVIVRCDFKEKTYCIIAQAAHVDQLPPEFHASSVVSASESAVAPAETATKAPAADLDSPAAPEGAAADSGGVESAAPIPESAGDDIINSPLSPGKPTKDETVPGSPPKSKAPKTVSTQRAEMDQKEKYATYSRSEVDQLLKQQAEQLAATLGAKISQQQRAFQDAMDKQEKSFSRISDSFASTLETARIKLETTAKSTSAETHKELDEFRRQLAKELESYRAQINKAATRETVKPAHLPADAPAVAAAQQKPAPPPKPVAPPHPGGAAPAAGRDQVVLGLLVAALVAAMVNFVTIMLSIGDVKQHLVELDAKVSKIAPAAPK